MWYCQPVCMNASQETLSTPCNYIQRTCFGTNAHQHQTTYRTSLQHGQSIWHRRCQSIHSCTPNYDPALLACCRQQTCTSRQDTTSCCALQVIVLALVEPYCVNGGPHQRVTMNVHYQKGFDTVLCIAGHCHGFGGGLPCERRSPG